MHALSNAGAGASTSAGASTGAGASMDREEARNREVNKSGLVIMQKRLGRDNADLESTML